MFKTVIHNPCFFLFLQKMLIKVCLRQKLWWGHELNWDCIVFGLDALSNRDSTPWHGMIDKNTRKQGHQSLASMTGTMRFAQATGQPLKSSFLHLACLSVTLFLPGLEAHFIVSVRCEPAVCLHSLSPLCQALTDKASTRANLPSSPLAVPGLHSTTN